jgi:hypothetical protein
VRYQTADLEVACNCPIEGASAGGITRLLAYGLFAADGTSHADVGYHRFRSGFRSAIVL